MTTTTSRTRGLAGVTAARRALLAHNPEIDNDERARQLRAVDDRAAELQAALDDDLAPVTDRDFESPLRPPTHPQPPYRPGADVVDFKARAAGERDDDQ